MSGNDEGQDLKYEPMTIRFTVNNSRLLTADGNESTMFNRPNGSGAYTGYYVLEQKTENNIKDEIDKQIGEIKQETGVEEEGLAILVKAMNSLFEVDQDTNPNQLLKKQKKIDAINLWNQYSNNKIQYNDTNLETEYNNISNKYKKYIYSYYEFLQFKRAHFKCEKAEYNEKTGRIISMNFKFLRKFE